mgnify:CR=1 FL=1
MTSKFYTTFFAECRKLILYLLIATCFIILFAIVAVAKNYDDSDVSCLAENMYWEARNQSKAAMLAVSHVVMNRVDDNRYPNNICDVVKQGPTRKSWKNPNVLIPVRNRCQFSWFCDGKSDIPPKVDSDLWLETQTLAKHFLFNYKWIIDPTDGATHYHAYYVRPSWAESKLRTARIESHIFYRWKK